MKDGCESQNTKIRRSIPLPVLPKSDSRKDINSHSPMSLRRAAVLIIVSLLMIAHIIQWLLTGRTVSPVEPSESMATLQTGAVNAGFIFFTLAIFATLIFGRFICGWGCHILALQDFCAWLLKKIGLRPKPFRSRLLVFVPLITALYMFVFPSVYRAFTLSKNETVVPHLTNGLLTDNFWETFPSVAVAVPFLFVCGFMTVYFLGQKGFCTYACPYGGFFGLADKFSPVRIRVTDSCNQCGNCTAVCTSNVVVHAEVKQYGMVVDPGCMKCLDCVSVCPNDALYLGFGKPAIAVKQSPKKNYSLTIAEEFAAAFVFGASFFAVWDVYQLVPMLMALGIAAVTTYIAFRTWRLVSSADSSFYRFNLKSGGKIRRAGWVFAFLALLWSGLVIHSGWIHYHESAGVVAYQNIKIPDELALARTNPTRWISAGDRENIAVGKSRLQTAARDGLFVNSAMLPKLAWLEYLSGNSDQAVDLLDKAAYYESGQRKALSLYYRGAILNRMKRFDEALRSINLALAERPDLVVADEEKGESLWQLGRKDEAVEIWNAAVTRNSNLPLANSFLAGAAALRGDSEAALKYENQAARYIPADPLFHWMVGMRLQNIGMNETAEKHFQEAIKLNPEFKRARTAE